MSGCFLEQLTWREAAGLIGPQATVVLPIGAQTKQHGPHLPLNNDWLIAQYLARRVVERCDVLVLPTLPYAHYPAFVAYPGSVSLASDTFSDSVIAIFRSFARHGVERFYALNTGISTLPGLERAQRSLDADGLHMDFLRLDEAWASVHGEVVSQREGSHADEVETSIMLYIAPEVVRMELAQPDMHPRRGPGPFTRDPEATRGRFSPTGSYGDPTLASRDKGERLVEAMVAHLVAELR